MLGWAIITVGVILEALILWRGCRRGLFAKFVLFYCYVATALIGTIWLAPFFRSPEYAHRYWIINFVTLFLGCGILWLMFSQIWLPLLNLRRAARIGQVALGLFVAAFIARFAAVERQTPVSNLAFRHLEQDCRAIQAVFFAAIVLLAFYYGVPVGKDLRAICLGYGLYVCVSLISLTVWLYAGHSVAVVCDDVEAATFDAATAIWLAGLWNPQQPLTALASNAEQTSKSGGGSLGSGVRSDAMMAPSGPKAARV